MVQAEHLQLEHPAHRRGGGITRRSLLVGVALAVPVGLSACSKDLQRDDLVAIAATDRQPGEPLWSAATNSFVVAVDDTGLEELRTLGAAYAALASNRLIALANECTFAASHRGKLAWCRPAGVLICLECSSRWTRFGSLLSGPAAISLTMLTVTVNGDDDVIIDRVARTPGRRAASPPAGADIACDQTFAPPA